MQERCSICTATKAFRIIPSMNWIDSTYVCTWRVNFQLEENLYEINWIASEEFIRQTYVKCSEYGDLLPTMLALMSKLLWLLIYLHIFVLLWAPNLASCLCVKINHEMVDSNSFSLIPASVPGHRFLRLPLTTVLSTSMPHTLSTQEGQPWGQPSSGNG